MTEKQRSVIPGIMLVVVGVLFLLHQMGVFFLRWRNLYPILMLTLGLLLFISLPRREDKGVIFPATVLTILGAFFMLRNFDIFSFDYYFYNPGHFWPIFLVAFGVGFIALFQVRRNDWGLLVPGGIMTFLGVVFFLRELGFYFWDDLVDYWPVVLILIGCAMILKSLKQPSDTDMQEPLGNQ